MKQELLNITETILNWPLWGQFVAVILFLIPVVTFYFRVIRPWRKERRRPNPTPPDKIGIWVGKLSGDPHDKYRAQLIENLQREMKAIEKRLQLKGITDSIHISSTKEDIHGNNISERHAYARELSRQYNATAILWGSVGQDDNFFPYLTVAKKGPGITKTDLDFPEVTRVLITELNEAGLPPTHIFEPTQLAQFLLGFSCHKNKDYRQSLKLFGDLLNKQTAQVVELNIVRFMAATCCLDIAPSQMDMTTYYNKATNWYHEILKQCTKDSHPLCFAKTQNNLGVAYRKLAEVWNKEANLSEAIKAFNEALKIFTFNAHPIDYANTQNNLGDAYRGLSEVRDKETNLGEAINAFEKALRVQDLGGYPVYYAGIQNNLGIAYWGLSEIRNKKADLYIAITAFNEALKVFTFNTHPIEYANAQNCLGIAYWRLSAVEDKQGNLDKALKALNKALRVKTFKTFPVDYALTKNNLGNIYGDLPDVKDKETNLGKAIHAHNEALRVYSIEHYPIGYANTQNNLGTTYGQLSEVKEKIKNLEKATKAFGEALKVRTKDKFPWDYVDTLGNMANAKFLQRNTLETKRILQEIIPLAKKLGHPKYIYYKDMFDKL